MKTEDLIDLLPERGERATLLGRAWIPSTDPGRPGGPSPVWLTADGVFDLSAVRATVSELVNDWSPEMLRSRQLRRVADIEPALANTLAAEPDPGLPRLLAPFDLQAVKACGVTFVSSLLERVIEERCGGRPETAARLREELGTALGTALGDIRPGTPEAEALKRHLVAEGAWSQYLEVGLGPDAEVFTKCQPMAAVGTGALIGIHPASRWSNPEPELVLVVDATGRIRGATLGNDVNLRDIEGRSALLLGKAKDNNASCAMGPCIRLFDDAFGLSDLADEEIELQIDGTDGFRLQGSSSLARIARTPEELVRQTINESRQFPDGLALFTGTMFAPVEDRDEPGMGFTHHEGDTVRIRSRHLGCLENRVTFSDRAPPWTFGTGALMRNLAARGLLSPNHPAA